MVYLSNWINFSLSKVEGILNYLYYFLLLLVVFQKGFVYKALSIFHLLGFQISAFLIISLDQEISLLNMGTFALTFYILKCNYFKKSMFL
jgi:hypothetical protein